MKAPLPSEREEQRAIIEWAGWAVPCCIVAHVPNEDASGSAARGKALLADGVVPGFPDLIFIQNGALTGSVVPLVALVEVKRRDKRNALSPAQQGMRDRAADLGIPWGVATGPEDAEMSLRRAGFALRSSFGNLYGGAAAKAEPPRGAPLSAYDRGFADARDAIAAALGGRGMRAAADLVAAAQWRANDNGASA